MTTQVNNTNKGWDALNERLHLIEKQMIRLDAQMDSEKGTVTRNLNDLLKITEKHHDLLLGNGNSGLRSRIERIEWSAKLLWMGLVGVAIPVLILLVETVRHFIT